MTVKPRETMENRTPDARIYGRDCAAGPVGHDRPRASGDRIAMTFDELESGQVISLGAIALDRRAIEGFCTTFAPDWDPMNGAPDAMVYAIWSLLEADSGRSAPQAKRLAVDALRWVRNPPAGELLRGRMTVMGKDPVGETKGVVITQNDLLDEA